MYSRNISNLFMAGRNVSVSHDALTVRMVRTGGVYEKHLDALLDAFQY